MHDLEFEHLHVGTADEPLNEVAWAADNVELTTVGIDIGSSTSHLMFARVHLQRLSTALSSRFVVVERKILWQSPIYFRRRPASSSAPRPDSTWNARWQRTARARWRSRAATMRRCSTWTSAGAPQNSPSSKKGAFLRLAPSRWAA